MDESQHGASSSQLPGQSCLLRGYPVWQHFCRTFSSATRSSTRAAEPEGTAGDASNATRAPTVTRSFVTAAIAPIRQERIAHGWAGHQLHNGARVGITVATSDAGGEPRGVSCFTDIEKIKRRLGTQLVHMQKNSIGIEKDDYGGEYLKFGHASGAGRYKKADAWVLPSHDEHMEAVATVFALMLPLLRFGALCLEQAGAQPDDCQFSLLRRQVERMGLDVSAHHCPPSFVVRGLVSSPPCGAHCDPDLDAPQVFVYMDHPDRDAPQGRAPASQLGVASGMLGGLTVELPTDNSTAAHSAVTGVVCNPRRNLHFTIDEEQGNQKLLSLVRVIFYHNDRTSRAKPAKVLSRPSGELKARPPFTCPKCEVTVVQSPHVNPEHWLHHFDAAVDQALGVPWTCGC